METGPDLAQPLTSAPRGCLLPMTSCPIVGPTVFTKKKKKKGENWELAAPRASFIWSIFITGQQQSPLSACCQKASPCWKSPFLKGIMFAFLKKVASAAELLAFQTTGPLGQERSSATLESSPAGFRPAPTCLPGSSSDFPPPTRPTTSSNCL